MQVAQFLARNGFTQVANLTGHPCVIPGSGPVSEAVLTQDEFDARSAARLPVALLRLHL